MYITIYFSIAQNTVVSLTLARRGAHNPLVCMEEQAWAACTAARTKQHDLVGKTRRGRETRASVLKRARRRIGHVARCTPMDGPRRHARTTETDKWCYFPLRHVLPRKEMFVQTPFFFLPETVSKYTSVRNKEQPCGSSILWFWTGSKFDLSR